MVPRPEDEFEPFEFEDALKQLHKDLDNVLIDDFPKNKRNAHFKNITENYLESLYETLHNSKRAIKFTEYNKPFNKSKHIDNIRIKFINNIDSFLSRDYKAPDDLICYQHLLSVYIFYLLLYMIEIIPLTMLLKIDFATAKINSYMVTLSFTLKFFGEQKNRIKRGQQRLKRKRADRKQPVVEEYHRIDTTGMSKNKIAKAIKENLGKWQKDVPYLNTIKRYLEEDELI